MKFFNTAGPVNQAEHYKINPLERLNLEDILSLIEQKKYFILHAPRQTGKTSTLFALQEYLNKQGKYYAIYVNIECAQSARNDIQIGISAIINILMTELNYLFPDKSVFFEEKALFINNKKSLADALREYLQIISQNLARPVVVLIDEIDALIGDTLISVLRQIRTGYAQRPYNFPSSIVLCGVRDIKDYRISRSDAQVITGGSAFNIKAESLRLGNFSIEDIKALYAEHTIETGQQFNEDCFNLIWEYTEGQPWLVNALAYEVCFKMVENKNRQKIINKEDIETAKNRLVISRQTHLDQLADKLDEDRVKRIILPIILGEYAEPQKDDVQYCLDLGLIKETNEGLKIANAIYNEVIPRELTEAKQCEFTTRFHTTWLNKNGSINSDILIGLFQNFWRENSGILASNVIGYQEAAPHLVFQAFLQRVANGNGIVCREYALGRKRLDLMLKWKFTNIDGISQEQRIVIELKIYKEKDNLTKLKDLALEQTYNYAVGVNATETHLLIFDKYHKTDWLENAFSEIITYKNMPIKVWGLATSDK